MTASSLAQELFDALADELAVVIGAMSDAPTSVVSTEPVLGPHWVADVRVGEGLSGQLKVGFEAAAAVAATQLMTGVDEELPEQVLVDTLREVFAQALAAVATKPLARGATFEVVGVAKTAQPSLEGDCSVHVLASDKLTAPLVLTMSGTVSTAPAAAVAASPIAIGGVSPTNSTVIPMSVDERIEVLLDIDLPLVVRFGRTELPLRHLTKLGPGSVIDLGRSPDDPVEVLVGNRVVARGEVVIVSGSYGVRILDVVSQRERVRSMEA